MTESSDISYPRVSELNSPGSDNVETCQEKVKIQNLPDELIAVEQQVPAHQIYLIQQSLEQLNTRLKLLAFQVKLLPKQATPPSSLLLLNKLSQLTSDDVTSAFLLLLGRKPENQEVIEYHLSFKTQDALIEQIMNSFEFRAKTGKKYSILSLRYLNTKVQGVVSRAWGSIRDILGLGADNPELSAREQYFLKLLSSRTKIRDQ